MINLLKKYASLIVSLGILWITVALLLVMSFITNQGHIVYALDDAYIHMVIAKNFALHGVWGITRFGFTSSSSSLLYTLLLSAIYSIFGINEVTPLILNIIFATLLICAIFYFLKQKKLNSLYIFLFLQLIIFLTPLPSLIFTGMEHTLQTLIVVSFVYLSAKIISQNKSTVKGDVSLIILGTLVTMIRYEGLFLLFIVCALFILRNRWMFSIFLLISGLLPITMFGIISLSNGWFFLPNSILLKGNMPTLSLIGLIKFFCFFIQKMIATTHIFILIFTALVLFIYQYDRQRKWVDTSIMLILFIFTSILHIMFAGTGWFYRYEAYLVGLGIFVTALGFQENLPQNLSIKFDKTLFPKYIALTIILILIISPFVGRGFSSLKQVPQATNNIYEQQYQMGLFLQQFYKGENIAVNDIGAVSYLGDTKTLDLWGLGSQEVAKLKIEGLYTTQQIQSLATQKGIKIAIIYDEWFKEYGGVPSNWIKVGEWTISNNVVTGGDVVSFYAVNSKEENNLKKKLKLFSTKMPMDINQSGSYLS